MPFSRARYVTLCQQSLVTAAVLAVGVSAAGVKTLDIVPQPNPLADGPSAAGALPAPAVNSAGDRAPVDVAPVNPKVREIRVAPVPTSAEPAGPRANARQPRPAEKPSTAPQVEGKPVVALSDPQPVTGYATVGVTWKHGVEYAEDDIAIQVRTRDNGAWSAWQPVAYHDDHGPDGAEAGEAGERPGTDAIVIGDVDQVQMRAETADGTVPPDLKLALIDPGTGKMTTQTPAIDTAKLSGSAGSGASSTQPAETEGASLSGMTLAAMKVAPKPQIYSRAQWGANEKIREQSKPSYGTIQTGFVHHTVNANNYSEGQVPALLRGIYAYHVKSRGWRDVGYNFLVDRFGRIWEGRWGGVDKAVVGAHTLGYNEVSFAMSAIGNFETARPPQAVLDAYAQLFAWKLSMYDIAANATGLRVKGKTLAAINGHRDVGQTACPGKYLYAKLPQIRSAAQQLQKAAQSGGGSTPPPVDPTPDPGDSGGSSAMTSPKQSPRPAVAQPSKIDFPESTNFTDTPHPDLVMRNSAGQLFIQPTGGQTELGGTVKTRGGWAKMNLVAAVGDVTGDGRSDLLGRIGKTTKVYAGDGKGRFATTGTSATRIFKRADQLMSAGRWNGDRQDGVLMRSKGGGLYLVPGLGKGRFGKAILLSGDWGAFRSTAVAGDLDRNGTPDLVATHDNGQLYVVTTTKSGKLNPARSIGSAGRTAVVGGGGDLTGDSVGDVFQRAPDGSFWILPGTGAGGLGAALGPFGRSRLVAPTAAPVMGTGQVDLVGLNARRNKVIVVPSNGRSNLRALVKTNVTMKVGKQLLSVGDWNGDGRNDLVTREGRRGNELKLHRGKGGGQFSEAVSMAHGWRGIKNLAAVGDVTGDGHPDLAGRVSKGSPVVIWPGDGKDGFLRPQLAPKSLRTFNQIGAGAWKPGSFPGSALISSDGAFVPLAAGTGGNPADYNWVIGPGDVDSDGQADVVARDASGRLWLLPGTTQGTGPRRLIGTGFSGYNLGG